MKKTKTYSPEVRERAVRMVLEHQKDHSSRWAATVSIAAKIGCRAKTLHSWLQQAERATGSQAGLSAAERERLNACKRAVSVALKRGLYSKKTQAPSFRWLKSCAFCCRAAAII